MLAVKDMECDEVEVLCKSTGYKPVAGIDSFTENKLGSADLVEEVYSSGSRMFKVTDTTGGSAPPTRHPGRPATARPSPSSSAAPTTSSNSAQSNRTSSQAGRCSLHPYSAPCIGVAYPTPPTPALSARVRSWPRRKSGNDRSAGAEPVDQSASGGNDINRCDIGNNPPA
ncbi:hypothetical protein CONLIGDRAFT_108351 [Coniochaeta ligniaria NRRL 30616]|uniref:Uncharacterized protein n=1 Tax=Coniochaeta ligniaria NRRL 30616 TaxID=1408157 RepID=A0A1J7J9P4_9PEZI|nr:hypothetical protein CONLIGDRAFT_108351 [Coniochaeta ligniaria NRRL 30616]